MTHDDDAAVEAACELMHDAYEAAAVEAGWATQERSRKPWADVPEANKVTMRAAVRALLDSPMIAERAVAREPGDGPEEGVHVCCVHTAHCFAGRREEPKEDGHV